MPTLEVVPITLPVLEHHCKVAICIDFFYVQGVLFFHSILQGIGCCTTKLVFNHEKTQTYRNLKLLSNFTSIVVSRCVMYMLTRNLIVYMMICYPLSSTLFHPLMMRNPLMSSMKNPSTKAMTRATSTHAPKMKMTLQQLCTATQLVNTKE